ncbi:MAG TPA: hypothetical protein VK002_03440 [Rubricoccaceae bacterium]|nr:hypothetical protein [Rubricoccaceae bacterium]
MRLVPFFVLAGLLALACAGSPSEDAPASEPLPPVGNPPMGGPDTTATDPDTTAVGPGVPLAEILDEAGDDAALLARLAAPRRIEAEPFPNRHVPGQVDTLRTYVYDGLTLEFYEIATGGVLLQTVEVTGGVYETAEGLGVGSTRDEVEAVYTHSVGAEGGTVTYERPGTPERPNPPQVEVRYDGDHVAAMTWRFYVD